MFSFDEELFKDALQKMKNAQEQVEDINEIIGLIKNINVECDFKDSINSVINSIQTIRGSIKEIYERMIRTIMFIEPSKTVYDFLKYTLGPLYTNDSWIKIFKSMLESDTSPFSWAPDRYGTSQSNPYELYEKYILDPEKLSDIERSKVEAIIDIFKNKGITDQNTIDYLLNYERLTGCGFAIVANVLCDAYKNNPDAFQKRHGYPLYYTQNGEMFFNYESIMTEMFLNVNDTKLGDLIDQKDNPGVMELLKFGIPINDTSIWFDEMTNIVNTADSAISGIIVKRDISVNTYKQIIESGNYDYACIAVRRFSLKPIGNNKHTDILEIEGGHWMQITGISSNNNFIVSSWGEKWELLSGDPYANEKILGFIPNNNENDGGLIFFKVGDLDVE